MLLGCQQFCNYVAQSGCDQLRCGIMMVLGHPLIWKGNYGQVPLRN